MCFTVELPREVAHRGRRKARCQERGSSTEVEPLSHWTRQSLVKCSKLLVAMRSGETPVPIPNTKVKTGTADGTALETVWESRWPPD